MRPTDLSAVFSQNNFGNRITMPGWAQYIEDPYPARTIVNADGTTTVIAAYAGVLAPAGLNRYAGIKNRLLTLDAALVADQMGHRHFVPELLNGSWVVSLDGLPTWADPARMPGLDLPACPLIAQIGYGTGGAQISVEVDVVPGNVISLPGIVAQIDVLWAPVTDFGLLPDATLISDNANVSSGGNPYLPESTLVSGTAVRSSLPAQGPAYRSIYMPRRAVGSANTYQVIYPIPNLARKVRCYDHPSGSAVSGSALYDAATTFSFRNMIITGASTDSMRLLAVTGAAMFAALQNGITIPKNATYILITAPSGIKIGGNSSSGSIPILEFELDL